MVVLAIAAAATLQILLFPMPGLNLSDPVYGGTPPSQNLAKVCATLVAKLLLGEVVSFMTVVNGICWTRWTMLGVAAESLICRSTRYPVNVLGKVTVTGLPDASDVKTPVFELSNCQE